MMMTQLRIDIQIKDSPLSTQECIDFVHDEKAGGNIFFVGTVRSNTGGRKVVKLIFEAYKPMALKEMRKIADRAKDRWSAIAISIHHRVGELEIGDIPVVIAVSTPHRKSAFEACQYMIDTLKEKVPIWKKEIYADGEIWVAAHP